MTMVDQSDPLSSAEFAVVDLDRLGEIATRHQRIAAFLRDDNFAAMLLQRPSNFSWFTCGASNERGGNTGLTGALFITPEARVIVCSNADTSMFFEAKVANMGFQLKERPWTEPLSVMIGDLCRGRRVASDTNFPNTTNIESKFLDFRVPLSQLEQNRLRDAGKMLTHAVEATARGISKGRNEAEVAGELSHRLLKKGLNPERLQILADGRSRRFRRWTFDESEIQNFCTISAIARYQGLYIGVARTVCLGEPPETLLASFEPAALVEATGIYFSQPEWEISEVWNRVHRIYEKTGMAAEWHMTDQADVVEFEFGTASVTPNSKRVLQANTPIFWHPSVGTVQMGDTVLTSPRGIEILTSTRDWPVVPITVKGTNVDVPAILVINS